MKYLNVLEALVYVAPSGHPLYNLQLVIDLNMNDIH